MTANSVSGTSLMHRQGGNVGAGAIVNIGGLTGTTNSSGDYTVYNVPIGSQSVSITQIRLC